MSSGSRQRLLPGRRLALLASAAGISAALVFGVGVVGQPLTLLSTPAYAQAAQKPVGFADIVEKVKPAVISVRVKMNAAPQASEFGGDDNPFGQNSPFQFFFKRFGQGMPNMPHAMPQGLASKSMPGTALTT